MGNTWSGKKTAAVVGGLTAGVFGGPFLLVAGAGFIWATFIKPDPKREDEAKKAKETKNAWKLGALVAGGTILGQAAILALASGSGELALGAAGVAVGVTAGVVMAKNIVSKLKERRQDSQQEIATVRSPGNK